jgi:uncharacterized membrane protein
MSTLTICSSSLIILLALFAPGQGGKAPADKGDKGDKKEKADFQKDVLPILEKNCLQCHHTPDAKDNRYRPKGGVILDNKEGITTSKKGKLIVAKHPEDSVLYQAVTKAADARNRMPPAKTAEPLGKETTEILKKWITEGADFGTWTGKKDDKSKKDEPAKPPKKDEPAKPPKK